MRHIAAYGILAEATDIAEAGVDPQMQRIAHVHHHRTTGPVVVTEEQTALGHPVFSMVDCWLRMPDAAEATNRP